jgi:tetratricopeptide (TPR) repeat protein
MAEKALDYARRAAERSLKLLAYEEAARQFAVGLRVLDGMEPPDDAARCDLLLSLGDAYARAGDTPRSKQTYREAARLAEALHLPEKLGNAALGYGGRLTWDAFRDDEHLASLLERALAALGDDDSNLRVRLLARLAGGPLRDSTADPERRRSLGADALGMARRIGDPSTLADALSGYINSHLSPDFPPRQLELATELVEAATKAGDLERAVEGYQYHVESSIELGDLASAHADLGAMTKLAEELRQPAQAWLIALVRAILALLEGRLAEAEHLIADARSVGERVQSWPASVYGSLQLYVLRREQGRLDEIADLVRRAVASNPTYPIWRCVQTNMLSELGASDEAESELRALAATRFDGLPFDEEWIVSLCFLAEASASLGDAESAAILSGLLMPYADRVATSYPEISLGPVSRFLGVLESATGRLNVAVEHYRAALEISARIGARPSLARTQENYARTLLERAQPGDAAAARDLLNGALATYRELGMDVRAASASRLLESTLLSGS